MKVNSGIKLVDIRRYFDSIALSLGETLRQLKMKPCKFIDNRRAWKNRWGRDASIRICEEVFAFMGAVKFHEDLLFSYLLTPVHEYQ